jgi:phosphatidylserine/phosphatidylglycerophosphate/cardiolipin synthase-like enzyme
MVFFTKTSFWFILTVVLIGILVIGTVKDDAWFGFDEFENLIPQMTDSNNISEVLFCPEDACADELVSQINSAQESVDIAIYSFTLDSISKALIDAKERGVVVRVIFDYVQAANKYSEDEKLLEENIFVKIKKGSGLMHNKFVVIDGVKVITGSFNYSQNANTKNDENLLILLNEMIAKEYAIEFEELWQEASE